MKKYLILLLVLFLLWRAYAAGHESADSDWSLRWLQRDLVDSTATLQRENAERVKEQRRQKAADEEEKRAASELAQVQADADAAHLAGDGLQQQLAILRRQLAGSETGRLSALAAAGAAKAETTRVLAELLGESDKRAGIYAKEADERYVSGQSCERTYERVTEN
ncbi:DUF2514 family protein [Enterobacter kobei]|nr:DUF2514 family protein [Enterobacter kobei]